MRENGARNGDDQCVRVLIEGFDADAVALALLPRRRGARRAPRGLRETPEPAVAADLGIGVTIVPSADLDADPGPAEIAYLDVWTPEVAPRVERLRAQGTRVSCLGDLLLERWPGPTIGITGTAGQDDDDRAHRPRSSATPASTSP